MRMWWCGPALLLAACETVLVTPDVPDLPPDTGPFDAGGPEAGSDAPRREAGPLPDTSPVSDDVDGNVTWDDAIPTEIGGAPVTGEVSHDGDRDYVRFEASEGDYLAVVIRRSPTIFFPLSPYPTVLDPDMRAFASPNDNRGCSGEVVGSETIFRVARTGTHYIELSAGLLPPSSTGPQGWTVEVIDLRTVPTTLVVEEDGAAPITDAHRCVIGGFESPGDVDEVPIGLSPYQTLRASDPVRHGSTGGVRRAEVRVGSTVRARLDAASVTVDAVNIAYDGAPGAVLRLEAPALAGPNDHYLLTTETLLRYGPGVRYEEADEAGNDTFAGAEPTGLWESDEGGYLPALALQLPPGDVDHFAVDVVGRIEVVCTAGRLGASPREVEVTLLDAGGAAITTARETRMTEPSFRRVLADGRYVIRLSAARNEPGIDGHLVACSVGTVE